MRYFAFISRDEERRYHAVLPDFPRHPAVVTQRLDALPAVAREALGMDRMGATLPPPTAATALPRLPGDHDGFWMQLDLAPPHD